MPKDAITVKVEAAGIEPIKSFLDCVINTVEAERQDKITKETGFIVIRRKLELLIESLDKE